MIKGACQLHSRFLRDFDFVKARNTHHLCFHRAGMLRYPSIILPCAHVVSTCAKLANVVLNELLKEAIDEPRPEGATRTS